MVQLQRVKFDDLLSLNLSLGAPSLIEPSIGNAGEVEGVSSSDRTAQAIVFA